MRYRLDELKAKKISQLRDVAATLQVNIRSCIDKSEVIERLIASGKIEVTEGVPTVMKTLEEFEAMGVGELRRLLLSFGLSDEGAIEKRELRSRLLESGRIIIEGGDDMKVGGGSGSGGYNSGGYNSGGYGSGAYGTPSGYSNGHDPYSGGSYSNGGYSSRGYSSGGYSTAGYTNGHDPGSSSSSSGGGSSSGGVGSSSDRCDDGVNTREDGEMVTNSSDHPTHANEQLSGAGGGSGGGSKRSYNNNDDNDNGDNDDYIHVNNDHRGNVGGGGGGVYESSSSPYSYVARPNSPAKSLRELVSQKIASSHDNDHGCDKVDTSASAAMIVDDDDNDGNEGNAGNEGKYTPLHQNNPTSTSTPPRSHHTSIPYPSSPGAMSVGSASSRTNNNRMATTSDTPLPPSSSVNSSSSSSSSPSPVAFFGSNVSPSSSSSSPYTRTPS